MPGSNEDATPFGNLPAVDTASPEPTQFEAKIGPGGRVVIPADIRAAMQLKEGDALIGAFDGTTVSFTTHMCLVRAIQRDLAKLVPPGVSLVDELIAERRAEAAKEEAEVAEWIARQKATGRSSSDKG